MTPPREVNEPGPPEQIKAVPVRHPGQWVAAALVALIVLAIAFVIGYTIGVAKWS